MNVIVTLLQAQCCQQISGTQVDVTNRIFRSNVLLKMLENHDQTTLECLEPQKIPLKVDAGC